jgi:hypothetical protein
MFCESSAGLRKSEALSLGGPVMPDFDDLLLNHRERYVNGILFDALDEPFCIDERAGREV